MTSLLNFAKSKASSARGALFVVIGTIALPTQAQIVPDATLPEPSAIAGDATNRSIVGGTQAGTNLFHSFAEFNIQPDERVSFEAASSVTDIFARVTGANASAIEGTLSSGANLFLLNPNGISWGTTARADVAGALTLSTADSVLFADGSRWDLETPPDRQLLTISAPIGLGLPDRGTLSITGELAIPAEETLRLASPTIAIAGAQVSAPGGRLDLAAGSGDWGLTTGFDGEGLTGAIELQGATVSTAGIGGGRLVVAGDRVAIAAGSALIADTLGDLDGIGLAVTANGLSVTGGSFLSSLTFGSGDAGDVRLAVGELTVTGLGYEILQQVYIGGALTGQLTPGVRFGGIFAGSAGAGNGGAVSVEADRITFRDGGTLIGSTFGGGAGSPVAIAAREAVMLHSSNISTLGAFGSTGRMGRVAVTAPRIEVLDGGTIASTTFTSQPGGAIDLVASDIVLSGAQLTALVPGGVLSNTIGSSGAAGDVTVRSERLRIVENTQIVSQSGAGLDDVVFDVGGSGGMLRIEATESIEIEGGSPLGFRSGITSATFTSSPAGDVEIATPYLRVSGDALVSASTLGVGLGGTVTIVASDRVDLVGEPDNPTPVAEITASSGSALFPIATGTGGNIDLSTPELNIDSGAIVRVSSLGVGDAGTLTIESDRLNVENAAIEASSAGGSGGNIVLTSRDLRLRDGATIVTDSLSVDGGNIAIATDTLVALENSDITANALAGFGGQVSIAADGIFGTEFRPALTPESDITATSARGSQFLGVVKLRTPDVNIAGEGLRPVQARPTESVAIADRCSRGTDSTFIVTSRDSSLDAIARNWAATLPLVQPDAVAAGAGDRASSERANLLEATGWATESGEVTLIGRATLPNSASEPCRSVRSRN